MSALDDLLAAVRRMVSAPFEPGCGDAPIQAAYDGLVTALAAYDSALGATLTHTRTDDSAPVRRDARQTSRKAGERVYKRGHLRHQMLRLFERGAMAPVIFEDLRQAGWTDFELAEQFPLRDIRTVGSARRDLELDGWIEDSGHTTVNPRTGNPCVIWALTPWALERLRGET